MPTVSELVNAGYGGYIGWDDASANADFNATGGSGKMTGGGSSSGGSPSLPKFEFDQKAAEKAAMEELRPYYESLLKIYNGDVAMAKKRIEEDYSRGLRYKKEETANALGDNEAARKENDRKFQLALGDLTQEMNSRGLNNSGIKTTETQEAKADDLFKQTQYDAAARDLTLGEKKYIEGQDVEKQRFMEDKGFSPSNVPGFYNEAQKKQFDLTAEQIQRAGDMVNMKRSQRFGDWQAGVTPIATAQPTNSVELLNKALTMSGLPATS